MGSSRPRPLRVIVLSRIAVVALLHFESAAAFLFASPHGVAVSQRRSVLPQLRTSGNGCRGAAQAVEAGWRRGQDWRGAQSGWRRAGRTCVQNTGTPEGAGGSSSNNENPESSKSICRTLELAFRKVWLRLYTTGADENYSLALKEFVKATIAAFDKGYSLQALILELRRHEIETGDPMVDKTVRLTDQERQTREVWLVLVYLTLHRMSYNPKKGVKPPKPDDVLGLQALVESTCEALEAGFSLNGLKLELSLRQSGEAPVPLTPAQLSLRSQWTRIVFLTSEVIASSKGT
eukprot:Tamp_23362.p1 GENE.Tamp_23362~~Tamp_23362.p1  ORF type:complete len:291 (+),score=38.38 Tamp_23362:1-873(+)